MAKKPQSAKAGMDTDAWSRFERTVDVVMKAKAKPKPKPKHRPAKAPASKSKPASNPRA